MFNVNELELMTIGKLEGESLVLPAWNGYLLQVLKEKEKKFKALEYRGAFFDLIDTIYNTKKDKPLIFIDGLENLTNIKTDNLLCFNYLNYEQYPSAFINKILNTVEANNYYFTCEMYSQDDNYSHNKYIQNNVFTYNYFSYDYLIKLANENELVLKYIGNKCLLYKEKLVKNTEINDIIETDIIMEEKPKKNRRK